MDIQRFEDRKKHHIQSSLDSKNQAIGLSGFDQIELVHDALPDLNFEEVSLEINSLGKTRNTPFFVAGMTAGHPDAFSMNRTLAERAAARGWWMGVGSQRRQLERNSDLVDQWKELRRSVPELVLISNLGISQLILSDLDQVKGIVDSIHANAIVIHLNALQEVIQEEGTPQFRGGWTALEKLVKKMSIPVLVKETGCGFSKRTLRRLQEMGVSAVDVSGLGGTHWGRIEGDRTTSHSLKSASETFKNWGISTYDSLLHAMEVLTGSQTEYWASGGIRTGLDAAKALVLGAKGVGFAQPALEKALLGAEELELWMERIEYELKVALFCTGCKNIVELRTQFPVKGMEEGIEWDLSPIKISKTDLSY
ncbi:MAG: type 2 isopentenyl-diphosphate Delta-isomerase [Bdellovibrionaceae bacterium]|nr:type 2 isopentenyl-diphosphate Delta-isomerase [Pseudobdellovibrionaceae bacterium]